MAWWAAPASVAAARGGGIAAVHPSVAWWAAPAPDSKPAPPVSIKPAQSSSTDSEQSHGAVAAPLVKTWTHIQSSSDLPPAADLAAPPPSPDSPLEAVAARIAASPPATAAAAAASSRPVRRAHAPEPPAAVDVTPPASFTAAAAAARLPPVAELASPPPSADSPLEVAAARLAASSTLLPWAVASSAVRAQPPTVKLVNTADGVETPAIAASADASTCAQSKIGKFALPAGEGFPLDAMADRLASAIPSPLHFSPLDTAATCQVVATPPSAVEADYFFKDAAPRDASQAMAAIQGRPRLAALLNPVSAPTPLEASAAVLAARARASPTGRAGMDPPRLLSELLCPPATATPLEASASVLAGRAAASKSGRAAMEPPPPMAELLHPPPAPSPLEASAAVLAAQAAISPTGLAAMEAPPPMADLLHPPPAETPLEQRAAALASDDAVADEAMLMRPRQPLPPVVAPDHDAVSPRWLADLLRPPAAMTPLQAAANVLNARAAVSLLGQAGLDLPTPLSELRHPPAAATPLQAAADALAVDDPVPGEAPPKWLVAPKKTEAVPFTFGVREVSPVAALMNPPPP
eukprot:TRINITY_DN28_c1_g1_i6.p1 TRINITY_DN28_c1_g1~~TRINITY_DN28_c1_g1_i6.p1  ORF type:complete len:580 (-),score=84.46 TRINITY_DN28_c1_g1_i6:984-2723(-)